MTHIIADNITSPLGMTTAQNLQHITAGDSALRRYEDKWGLPEPFVASLLSDEQWQQVSIQGFSRFESLVIHSIQEALTHTDEDVLKANTCLIISTTKANVEYLDGGASGQEQYTSPAESATKISQHLGLSTEPIVVCNACISGVAAQVLAKRLLDAKLYDYAIIAGCDVQSKFIVSGFQSLKAVSDAQCRPFDIERLGLNLGEAASTIIMSGKDNANGDWYMNAGAQSNDALHITNPSPKGTGSAAVLNAVTCGISDDELALINVHGTATMYNDQMESKAIESAGLSATPINALKGYYGHTMGAAGLLETVLSLHLLKQGLIVGTRGFDEIGVSGKVNISADTRTTDRRTLIKLISGFGGCNGAVLYSPKPSCGNQGAMPAELCTTHSVSITPDSISLDNQPLDTEGQGKAMLTAAYKKFIGDYPKFYKMDILSKLGFIASELLLQAETSGKQAEIGDKQAETSGERFTPRDNRAVILFNRSSSICADLDYQKSIADPTDFFPSPSVFVYTLPNIVTGEIAIRNNYQGETSFYILPSADHNLMNNIIRASFLCQQTTSMITGWINADSPENFEAQLAIITTK